MNRTISNKTAACSGAIIAVAAVFAYSFFVMLYAIIRSSVSISSIMPSTERSTILWANGFSMAYAVAVFSLLMAVISSIAGAMVGIVLTKVLRWCNPYFYFNKAVLISSITALVSLLLLYLLLYLLLKERITFQYAETFLFWYAIPALIFFIVVVISGVKVTKQMQAKKI